MKPQSNLVLPPPSLIQKPPGPDVKVLVPNAGPIIAAGQQQQIAPEPSMPIIASNSPKPPVFSLDSLFGGQALPGAIALQAPLSDPFTLYLLATLQRFAYNPTGYGSALITGIFTGLTYTHVSLTSPTLTDGFDCWTDSQGRSVYVIPAQYSLKAWKSLPPYTIKAGAPLRSGLAGYSGLLQSLQSSVAAFDAYQAAKTNPSAPTIIVGHDQGGVLAQFEGMRINDKFAGSSAWLNPAQPVTGVYSFGSPDWLASNKTTNPTAEVSNHVQVVLTGDPIIGFINALARSLASGQAGFGFPYSPPPPNPPPGYVPATPVYPIALRKYLNAANAPINSPLQSAWSDWYLALPDFASVAMLTNYHSMSAYTLNLEANLRNSGAFDVNLFPLLVAANRSMDAVDASS